MLPGPPLNKNDEDPGQDVPLHIHTNASAPPNSPTARVLDIDPQISSTGVADEDVTLVATASSRMRNCKIKQIRFVYPAKSDQVQILRPCLEWNCKTCRVYQRHHFTGLEPQAAPGLSRSRPEHQQLSPDSSCSSTEPLLPRAQLERIRCLEDVEAERAQRTRPRFRKRIVLKFTKPAVSGQTTGSAYHAFASYIRANNIPLYTGPSGIRGGMQVLRFREKKDEFSTLVAGWAEDRDDAKERPEEKEVKQNEEEDDWYEDVLEEEEGEEGGEREAEIPREHDADRAVSSFERPADQWWDEEDDNGRRWRRRVW